jgi:hypothetical protein
VSGARWWRRLAAGLATFAVLEVVLVLVDMQPDAVRVGLLVAICVAVLGLVLDALSDGAVSWDIEVERPSVREAGDARLTRYVQLLEAHEAARAPDPALRDRLGGLVDRVLAQRHGLRREDPRAAELLGPELTAVLDGPPRRLPPAEIDRCLTRIEEL